MKRNESPSGGAHVAVRELTVVVKVRFEIRPGAVQESHGQTGDTQPTWQEKLPALPV